MHDAGRWVQGALSRVQGAAYRVQRGGDRVERTGERGAGKGEKGKETGERGKGKGYHNALARPRRPPEEAPLTVVHANHLHPQHPVRDAVRIPHNTTGRCDCVKSL